MRTASEASRSQCPCRHESRASIALASALASVGASSRSRISSRLRVRPLERVGHRGLEVRVGERLRHEAGRAARQGLAERVVRAGTGDEHDRQGRPMAPHELEQIETGEAGHDHVADDEVELGGRRAGSAPARRSLRPTPCGRRSRVSPRSGCGSPPRRRSRGSGSLRASLGDREAEGERRAVPVLGGGRQRPAVRLGDPEADREPEPGAAGEALGREERFEDPLERSRARCPDRRRSRPRSRVRRRDARRMPTLPPFGIACRAFAIRLRKICLSWFGLASTRVPSSA